MLPDFEGTLKKARGGDIRAFHELFAEIQPQLKSYLYRLLAGRHETDDLTQDTFVQAFQSLPSFKGRSGFKTWLFSIATHLALQWLKKKKRWVVDTPQRTRDFAHAHAEVMGLIGRTHQSSPYGEYEIREHIDFCFTCMSKTLPIEQQVALILKDVYDFRVKEIAKIMKSTEGRVKHWLHDARKTMIEVFDHQCAFVNKNGVCYQCSGLNQKFNPKQDTQQALMKIRMVNEAQDKTKTQLYKLRTELVKLINPLEARGAELHEVLLRIAGQVNEMDWHASRDEGRHKKDRHGENRVKREGKI